MVEQHSSNFRVITTNVLGVRIFRKFTVPLFVTKDSCPWFTLPAQRGTFHFSCILFYFAETKYTVLNFFSHNHIFLKMSSHNLSFITSIFQLLKVKLKIAVKCQTVKISPTLMASTCEIALNYRSQLLSEEV